MVRDVIPCQLSPAAGKYWNTTDPTKLPTLLPDFPRHVSYASLWNVMELAYEINSSFMLLPDGTEVAKSKRCSTYTHDCWGRGHMWAKSWNSPHLEDSDPLSVMPQLSIDNVHAGNSWPSCSLCSCQTIACECTKWSRVQTAAILYVQWRYSAELPPLCQIDDTLETGTFDPRLFITADRLQAMGFGRNPCVDRLQCF